MEEDIKPKVDIYLRDSRRRRLRKIKGNWHDEKIYRLIQIVEQRPLLWDVKQCSYRVPKPHLWKEVAAKLNDNNSNEFSSKQCKLKWQSLRVQFKTNLAKSLKTNASDWSSVPVPWRFFKAMLFLETGETQNATASTSNFSPIESISSPTPESSSDELSSPSIIYEKRPKRLTLTPTPVVSPPIKTVKDIPIHIPNPVPLPGPFPGPVPVEYKMNHHNDEHSVFGELITTELRRLPSNSAQLLKRKLTRTLLEFWDEDALSIDPIQLANVKHFY